MNPLTQVKRIQKLNATEASLGLSEEASWHAKYRDSAYVFVGGVPFDLSEGDLLAVFAQYGEVVDVNLVRNKETGKSRGFAFLAYEDQRSTVLAVDNLNGAKLLGRIIRVDHVSKYKKKEEEEEENQGKREARGVCYAFQKGECNRGGSCKFSHDEKRSADTGWGPKENTTRWEQDMHNCPSKSHGKHSQSHLNEAPSHQSHGEDSISELRDKGIRSMRKKELTNKPHEEMDQTSDGQYRRRSDKKSDRGGHGRESRGGAVKDTSRSFGNKLELHEEDGVARQESRERSHSHRER